MATITIKEAFVILVITIAACAAGGLTPGMRVKYDVRGTPGLDYFYGVPRNVSEASSAGWTVTDPPAELIRGLVLYCPMDKAVCVFMDDTGYIAGLQVGIRKDQFTNNVFDWNRQGYTSWKTTVDGKPVKFWTLQEYFISKETLKRSPKDRIAARDHTRILQEDAVWFTGIDHKLLKVSTSEKRIMKTIFTTQACLPSMGNHYYYNVSATTECVSDQIYPWFVLMFKGEMIGMGFLTFGQLHVDYGRDWFEHPGLPTIQAVVPYGPQCMYRLAENPGAVTMHIYFVDDPTNITCEPQLSHHTRNNYNNNY